VPVATASREDIVRLRQFYAAGTHPRYFLPHLTAPDSRGGGLFQFATVNEAEAADLELPFVGAPVKVRRGHTARGCDSWLWQRDYLDTIIENPFTVTLKARQLGVSWIWDGAILWDLCFFPGIDDLIYSIKEDDAIEQVNRVWDLWLSVPDWFKALLDLKVIKPYGDARPASRIELEHPDGRLSTVTGMPATKKAGHSRVARRVLFDEMAHQEYAREIWKAIIPAAGDLGGNIGGVSTANGMSDGQGGGNFFHEVYTGAGGIDYPNVQAIFLPWHNHPARTQEWYEGLNLDKASKAEQYPEDDDEAFLLTGHPYFDLEALQHFSRAARVEPLFLAEFETYSNNLTRARLVKKTGGPIEVYRRPEKGRKYAIGVDTATGEGSDYSVGAVIDLSDGAPCAELRMKADYTDFTRQLHFLGNWYAGPGGIPALVGVEDQGGYGKVVIAYLRDGHEGRKPYSNLYRHREYDDRTKKFKKKLGFPMNTQTRPKIVAELGQWVNRRLWPWVTRRFSVEARTFIRASTRPSPRAADGSNDDVVMAWGIALELFSQYGEHPHDIRKTITVAQERPVMETDPRLNQNPDDPRRR
jgi:hypothetical protein